MTATIRETNVFTDTFLCVYSKLEAISDPLSRNAKWIFTTFPEGDIDKKTDYPLIILNSSDVNYAPLTFGEKRGPIRFAIDVYSASAKQMDSLCDSVINTMETNEDNFQTSGIVTMRMISSSYGFYPRGAFRVHNKTLVYEFDFGWY